VSAAAEINFKYVQSAAPVTLFVQPAPQYQQNQKSGGPPRSSVMAHVPAPAIPDDCLCARDRALVGIVGGIFDALAAESTSSAVCSALLATCEIAINASAFSDDAPRIIHIRTSLAQSRERGRQHQSYRYKYLHDVHPLVIRQSVRSDGLSAQTPYASTV
jgi:hypothetical protein